MPRIRAIHAAMGESKDISKLSLPARYFFSLLWTHMDDDGKAEWLPRKLLGLMYAHDESLGIKDISGWYQECLKIGLLVQYIIGDQVFFCSPTWSKFQKPSRPTASTIPDCPLTDIEALSEDSVKTHGDTHETPCAEPKPKPVPKPYLDDDFFNQVKTEYPKRYGDLCWKKAESKISTIPIKERESVLRGIVNYRKHLEHIGKVGTEFVKQAPTFFNGETWREFQTEPIPPPNQNSKTQVVKDELYWGTND